jgi:phosphatidylserine/phosphatidylglycerophosphate/cardiolipin synthase-like enzyme
MNEYRYKIDQILEYMTSNFGQSFTNGTRKEIADLINVLSREEIGELRYRLFNEARRLTVTNNGQQSLFWLQNCFDLIGQCKFSMHKVYFSPGTDILDSITDLLKQANHTLDICVFTITDERLANDILSCHQRGIKVRIITDDEKIHDHGSSIKGLKKAGILIKIDHSQYYMHHKFGIIDSRIVFTGSFNWTYSASKHNQENLLVTTNSDIVTQYAEQYEQLWKEMFKL